MYAFTGLHCDVLHSARPLVPQETFRSAVVPAGSLDPAESEVKKLLGAGKFEIALVVIVAGLFFSGVAVAQEARQGHTFSYQVQPK